MPSSCSMPFTPHYHHCSALKMSVMTTSSKFSMTPWKNCLLSLLSLLLPQAQHDPENVHLACTTTHSISADSKGQELYQAVLWWPGPPHQLLILEFAHLRAAEVTYQHPVLDLLTLVKLKLPKLWGEVVVLPLIHCRVDRLGCGLVFLSCTLLAYMNHLPSKILTIVLYNVAVLYACQYTRAWMCLDAPRLLYPCNWLFSKVSRFPSFPCHVGHSWRLTAKCKHMLHIQSIYRLILLGVSTSSIGLNILDVLNGLNLKLVSLRLMCIMKFNLLSLLH